VSTRDQHVLAYAEYLHSDPALWRITVTYMYSCGEVGKQQADEILLRVPLRLHEQPESNAERQIKAGDVVGVLKAVVETCSQYNREAVRRTVCRVSQKQSSTMMNDVMYVVIQDSRTNTCSRERLRVGGFVLRICRGLARFGACCQPSS
jgi:nuclear pore complex protein Nup85